MEIELEHREMPAVARLRQCDPVRTVIGERHMAGTPRGLRLHAFVERNCADIGIARNTIEKDADVAAVRRVDEAVASRSGTGGRLNGRLQPREVPRVTLSIDEAAVALGISRDHLERHVLPELRVIRCGRRVLIRVAELERWAQRREALGA